MRSDGETTYGPESETVVAARGVGPTTGRRRRKEDVTYKRILVPLDGSPMAEQVLPYVRLLRAAFCARVDLVTVTGQAPRDITALGRTGDLSKLIEDLKAHRRKYLSGVGATLGHVDAPVNIETHEGRPAERIVAEAARVPGTLIAMSTHGHSGATRWLLGSVTDQVLHETTAPLLTVRAREGAPTEGHATVKNIIVPLDGSEAAQSSLDHVVALSTALEATVVLLQVVPTLTYAYGYMEYPLTGYERIFEAAEDSAVAYLKGVAAKLKEKGVLTVEMTVRRGGPALAIVDAALQYPDHLVVINTLGRTGMGRWFVGSVTDSVVRHSRGPVLVFRSAVG